ncbi:MAG: hypothetical protein IJH91_00555 [Mogibacterium sp.]|nr:hypothetical protein [Mogibacterium sp.]
MNKTELIFNEIRAAFQDRSYLQSEGVSRAVVQDRQPAFRALSEELCSYADTNGRFRAADVLLVAKHYLPELSGEEPPEGWQQHCYRYVLNRIFPHLDGPSDPGHFRHGRLTALTLLRGVFSYERNECRFDPTLDIPLLNDAEVQSEGYISEYIKMRRLARSNYIYEFMRIGSEMTPFNTLGHIAGVHYVATYVARQLRAAGVPVDVALVSGAAASHDIGKYGCRKSEERRVPYLHYYYTNFCMTGNDLPIIAQIAANHSTWDLEFENLTAESLLLIYADFRVKSSRDADGREIIHFYTLDEAFDVILSKLDNVDAAKRHRYEKVYARLKDFEDYMIDRGIRTDMPDDFGLVDGVITKLPESGFAYRQDAPVRTHRELSLIHGDEIIRQLKLKAVDHNIRLMHHFSNRRDFVTLIETARSESDWKKLRTYITILGDYSTYMSEDQKSLTLRFLYDQLAHSKSDIREQSARQMGQIVARFREAYKKELPEDIPKLDETTTNLEMFEHYLARFLHPSSKLTDQHRRWIIQSTDFFVKEVIENCASRFRSRYLSILEKYYVQDTYDDYTIMSILNTPLVLDRSLCTEGFIHTVTAFTASVLGKYDSNIDLLALDLLEHFSGDPDGAVMKQRRSIMGIDADLKTVDSVLSGMFLDDLKVQVSWIKKVANIRYMAEVSRTAGSNVRLHIATHFVNLIKMSETVTVRKEAGSALLQLIRDMPLDQRNEIMVELYNGLEIEDYQFSRFIPDFLGMVLLFLPEREFDEALLDLTDCLNAGNPKAASAALVTISIALEYYRLYAFATSEDLRRNHICKLSGLLMKGFAYYKDVISEEAFRTLGEHVFSSSFMSYEEKRTVLELTGKRILMLVSDDEGERTALGFYNNASALNQIYRYISEYLAEVGPFSFAQKDKVAFFPGTFDPFSLGHKAIARTIRDLGFEVYLALDEFSWSKKTLPHMLRREILSMSIADETDMYIFPDEIPVNIANPEDLAALRALFAGRELYIAVGSDVVQNASGYKAKPSRNSIHSFNHIIFARGTRKGTQTADPAYPIKGDTIHLTLRKYYEDISSTRIRESIDLGRDISNLLDPIVQNYIYEKNLYVRQPAYKHEIQARDIHISGYEHANFKTVLRSADDLARKGYDSKRLAEYLGRPRVKTVYIESDTAERQLYAFASARRIDRHDLLFEFGDTDITNYIRAKATGSIGVIGALYIGKARNVSNLGQIILTEVLTDLLAKDYGYVIYHPIDPAGMNAATVDVLRRQGFINISTDHNNPIYAVDMTSPIVIFRDVETVIKAPFDKNPRVRRAVDEAHNKLLRTFCELYPGKLILSFNTSAVYSKIVNMVAKENGVSTVPDPARRRGPYMAVPFGKALSDVVVPNTVTKALRTEKYFNDAVTGFTIRESVGYADLTVQAKTLKSFRRPVILIDDLLHSGQRMRKIDQVLRENDVEVRKVIVGLLTGNARDSMTVSRRAVDGAYFIPSIAMWLNERDCYPFIGGDSIDSNQGVETSINLIMPYTSYNFVGGENADMIYKYSMTCLENARDILHVIEQEYQTTFEKQLTLGRLGAVITHPRRPDYGNGVRYDENISPSAYLENDIKLAERLHLTRHRSQF